VSNFNKKVEELQESFRSIVYKKREFYPKNFNLSEDFVKAFKSEYKRLIDEGLEPKKALVRLNKALLFHTVNQ
jgi:hypothetical protein